MKIVYFANNRVGLEVLRQLVGLGEELVGLGVHPVERARYRAEILAIAAVAEDRVFEGHQLREASTTERLAALEPDLGISVLYDYIFPVDVIGVFKRGMINLHPSLLPWNRGQFPNVWSLVDGTPSGVTLHWIDEGVDTGDIIAQLEVPVESVDTGATLYRKLEDAAMGLFREAWPAIRDGTARRHAQEPGGGTYHRRREVDTIDCIDLDAPTTARQLLNRIRARTFRPYESTWFKAEDGRRVYVRVSLEYGEEA